MTDFFRETVRSPKRSSAVHAQDLDTHQPMTKKEIVTTYLDGLAGPDGAIEPTNNLITARSRSSEVPTEQPFAIGRTAHTPRALNQPHRVDEVTVCLRLKPLETEKDGLQYEIDSPVADKESYFNVHLGSTARIYRFARIFDETSTPEDVNEYLLPQIHARLKHHQNVSIGCYGPTGSGKTYTMSSVMPFVIREIFKNYAKMGTTFEMAAIQIYCDKVFSLISDEDISEPQIITTKSNVLNTAVPSVRVKNYADAVQTLKAAQKMRVHGGARSNRSHTMIFLYMISGDTKTKISFVDLASSDWQVKRSGSNGQAYQEGISINRSLSSLFGLLSSIKRSNKLNQQQHNRSFLYRGNCLTQYLYSVASSSFFLIANISSEAPSSFETKAALDFASLSQKVKFDQNKMICPSTPSRRSVGSEGSETRKILGHRFLQTMEVFTNFDKDESVNDTPNRGPRELSLEVQRNFDSPSAEIEHQPRNSVNETCRMNLFDRLPAESQMAVSPVETGSAQSASVKDMNEDPISSGHPVEEVPTPEMVHETPVEFSTQENFKEIDQPVTATEAIIDPVKLESSPKSVTTPDIAQDTADKSTHPTKIDSSPIQKKLIVDPFHYTSSGEADADRADIRYDTIVDPFNSKNISSQMLFYPVKSGESEPVRVQWRVYAVLSRIRLPNVRFPKWSSRTQSSFIDAFLKTIICLSLVYGYIIPFLVQHVVAMVSGL